MRPRPCLPFPATHRRGPTRCVRWLPPTGGRGGALRSRSRRSWCSFAVRSLERVHADHQCGFGKGRAQADRHGRAKAEVYVVPEHRRVGAVVDEEAGRVDGVAVALDDLHSGAVRDARNRVGQLADPAADRGDHAPAAKLAAEDIAFAPGRPSRCIPEAEHFAGIKQDAVNRGYSDAQVLDLAEFELLLARLARRVDRVLVAAERTGVGRDRSEPAIVWNGSPELALRSNRRAISARDFSQKIALAV